VGLVVGLAAVMAPAARAVPPWPDWADGLAGGGSATIAIGEAGDGCGAVVEGRAGGGITSSSSSSSQVLGDGSSCSVEASVTGSGAEVTCALRVEIDGTVVFDERQTGATCRLEYPLPAPPPQP